MLSRPMINASTILRYNPLAHESYVEQYAKDDDFKDIYEALTHGNQQSDYYMHENLLYHLGKLCIPRDERVNVIREAHTSLISGHFGVGKTIAQLQRYCYWPRMNETISKYIKGCVMCATSKPSNIKLGLYMPLLVPSQPWESISMDFVGGLSMSRTGHDYLYVVVDRFSKMCILIPCKKQVTTEQTTHMFFANVWVHFGFLHLLYQIETLTFWESFGLIYGSLWTLS
jgi:hypothetical protein